MHTGHMLASVLLIIYYYVGDQYTISHYSSKFIKKNKYSFKNDLVSQSTPITGDSSRPTCSTLFPQSAPPALRPYLPRARRMRNTLDA